VFQARPHSDGARGWGSKPCIHKMSTCVAYAAESATSPLAQTTIARRGVGSADVDIAIMYTGVCHSDLHTARNEWHGTKYPSVPGHEVVGRVVAVGPSVKKVKVGDLAAVGCMVDSCRLCAACKEGVEQYCDSFVGTYNAPDSVLGGHTFGGYSTRIVVDQDFVLTVPESLAGQLPAVAPLLCAGITTYSPLMKWKVSKGQKVGVVGLGGLGHMGVKFAKGLGASVVLFTTSASKVADAKRLGADEVVLSNEKTQMDAHAGSFDFILNTVAAVIDIDAYLGLLKRDGTLVQVGAPGEPQPVNVFGLIFKRRAYAGSLIGGIAETQEMLEFCAKHSIVSDVEVIPMKDINVAYERMLKSDVKYRFVIDMATLT